MWNRYVLPMTQQRPANYWTYNNGGNMQLTVIGPEIGYHPNAIKTHLVVKLELLDEETKLFENTNVQITTQGHETPRCSDRNGELCRGISCWLKWKKGWQRSHLFLNLHSPNHMHAYRAFVHGLVGRWEYVMRTIENTSALFTLLAIHQQFIPTLTWHEPCSQEDFRQVEMASFTPLVLTTTGRHGQRSNNLLQTASRPYRSQEQFCL